MIRRYDTFDRLFEFHHVNPATKNPNYNNLIRQQLSAKQIEEVDKCTLLCSNCHKILHAQNITANAELTVDIAGRKVSQHLSGWVIVNREDRTGRFVTNERFLLHPCTVRFAKGEPQVLCCIELEQETHLHHWMRHAVELGRIEISSYLTNEPLMLIEPTGPKSLNITQRAGFPVVAIDMATNGSKADNLWVRNGYLLTKDGQIHTEGTFSYNCDLR